MHSQMFDISHPREISDPSGLSVGTEHPNLFRSVRVVRDGAVLGRRKIVTLLTESAFRLIVNRFLVSA